MDDVVRLDCEEALVAPGPKILSQRSVSWTVQVPAAWVADGTVQPSYEWSLDLGRLVRREELPDVTDKLHLALMARYIASARAAAHAAPDDPNRTQPLRVAYRKATAEDGAPKLQLTEDGKLKAI